MAVEKQEFCELKPFLGTLNCITNILHRQSVDAVVFAVPVKELMEVSSAIELCEIEGVETHIISDLFHRIVARLRVERETRYNLFLAGAGAQCDI